MSGENKKPQARASVQGPRVVTRDKVLAALARGPGTQAELARRTGLDRTTVATALKWMHAHGDPVSSGELGIWVLNGDPPPPAARAASRAARPYSARGASEGPKQQTRERLAAALDQGPATREVIARRTGLNPQTIDLTLRYMRDQGEVDKWYVPGVKGLVFGWARDMPEGAPRSSEEAILQAGRVARTQEQIARLAGMERSQVQRVLARLVSEGRMRRGRGFYRTVDT